VHNCDHARVQWAKEYRRHGQVAAICMTSRLRWVCVRRSPNRTWLIPRRGRPKLEHSNVPQQLRPQCQLLSFPVMRAIFPVGMDMGLGIKCSWGSEGNGFSFGWVALSVTPIAGYRSSVAGTVNHLIIWPWNLHIAHGCEHILWFLEWFAWRKTEFFNCLGNYVRKWFVKLKSYLSY